MALRPDKIDFIESLPIELLIRIFEYALNDVEDTNCRTSHNYLKLINVSLVARRWNDVIHSSSSLLTHVDNRLPTAVLQDFLTRSKAHPLTVSCLSGPLEAREALLALASQHLARWKSFSLYLPLRRQQPYSNILQQLQQLQQPAHRLERLEVWKESDEHEPLLDWFGGQADRLQKLSLKNVAIPWDAPMLSGLRSLKIAKLNNNVPTALEILDILSRCPNLEALILDWIMCPATPLPPGYHFPPLLSLHTIEMSCVSYALGVLLQHIQAPACRRFKINGFPWCPSPEAAESLVLSFVPILENILPSSKFLTVKVHDGFFQCQASEFFAEFSSTDPIGVNALLHISPALSTYSKSSKFSLLFGGDHGRTLTLPSDLKPVLRRLHRVAELHISTTENLNRLVAPILAHTTSYDGTHVWPFPNLQTLVLATDRATLEFKIDDVIQFVKVRYLDTNSDVGRCVPL